MRTADLGRFATSALFMTVLVGACGSSGGSSSSGSSASTGSGGAAPAAARDLDRRRHNHHERLRDGGRNQTRDRAVRGPGRDRRVHAADLVR